MQYLTPDHVKGYTVHRKISEGGFGEVYLATETRPNFEREVVLKRILPKFGNDPRFIQRFESEARTIARLEYPYIVPLYDYWRNPDGAYLVMRWLKGGSVKDKLESGPLDLETTVRIVNHVCSALALSHRNGVIHRDVKPGNILLDEEGNAFLSDFGIAKDFMKFDSKTQPEDIIGSPKYISPEQARNDPVTPRTDVYSLGVTLYEMLAGEHPFPNANMYDLIYKHLNEPLPLLTSLDAAVQDDINVVIQKATEKNPANRYEHAIDFARAFQAAAQLETTTRTENIEQQLTIREQQTLCLLMKGMTNKEIAAELFVEHDTVRWHLRNAYKKLGVSRREQAIVVARTLNLVCEDGTIVADSGTSYVIEFEPENPYKGLEAFSYADASNFYGREKVVEKLLMRAEQDHPHNRFLAVLGPSGSGKSSLVKAGLVPARWESESGNDAKWLVTDMFPGEHPVDELDIALRRVATRHADGLSDLLGHNERGLVKAAQLILPDNNDEILLIIDQFEEVFTLVESEEERIQFLNLITNAVTDRASRVRIVITIRADYFDRPLYYPDFGDILRDRVETVLPLSAEELEQAIVQPARKVGVKFEDGLVASIVSDIHYQPGALPLLQYALTELFDRRDGRKITREVYEQIGGAAGAIASTAEELFQSYDETGQETIRQMFLRLVTLGEGAEDTRRRTARDELLSVADDSYLMDEIIDTFAYARMLSLDNDPTTREPTVEVAHEAILREWERLRGWLNDSRDDIKTQRRLSQNAEAWRASNYDDSYLIGGSRLDQFERWFGGTSLSLSPVEAQFLDASVAAREDRQAKEKAQAEREANLQLRARRVLQGLVAVFVVATIISAGLALFAFDAQAESDQARIDAEREADVAQSIALAAESQQVLINGDHDLALILALEANNIDNPPIEAERALSRAAFAPGTRFVMEGHQGTVSTVDISPDGRYGISAGGKQWIAETAVDNRNVTYDSQDFIIRLWDLQIGEEIRQFKGHTDAVWDVEFSPDGLTILSASSDETLILWDVGTSEIIHRLEGHNGRVGALAYFPDSNSAISSNSYSTIIWDLEIGLMRREIIHQFLPGKKGHRWDTWDIDISPDGQYALFGMRPGNGPKPSDGAAILMNLNDLLRDLKDDPWPLRFDTQGPVDRVAFSPDGKTALIGTHEEAEFTFGTFTSNPIVIHIDLETGQEISRFYHTGSFITGVAFSPDGKFMISTNVSQGVYLWDLHTGENVLRMIGHEDWLLDMAISPDGAQLLTGADDGTVRLWDLRNGTEVNRIDASPTGEHSLAISYDGRLAAYPFRRRRLILWDVQTGEVLHDLGVRSQAILGLAFSPDTKRLAVTSRNLLQVYDTVSGNLLLEKSIIGGIGQIQFTQDGHFLFGPAALSESIGSRARFQLVDSVTGEIIRDYQGSEVWSNSSDISKDGQTAFGAGFDGNIYGWDLHTTELIHEFGSPLGQRFGIKVDANNKVVLTISEHIEVLMWDIENGTLIRELEGHSDFPVALDVSSDGTQAITTSAAREMIVWDLASGQDERSLFGLEHEVNKIQFMSDGQRVIGSTRGGYIIIWRISDTSEETIAWAHQNRYIREFTCLERERYNIAPLCGSVTDEPQMTRTPYPTLTPSVTPSMTPTYDPAQISPTPTWTAIPSYTPLPTATPPPATKIELGVPLRDNMPPTQKTPDLFTFEGVAGMELVVQASTIVGTFTTEIYDPDGNLIAAEVESVLLPVDGAYTIAVLPSDLFSGRYQITITDVSE